MQEKCAKANTTRQMNLENGEEGSELGSQGVNGIVKIR